MLQSLIRFSIQRAPLVILLGLVLLAVAAYRLPRMPVDVFPELNAPTVVVMVESAGLAADEVEQYVAYPVESAVNSIPGVRRVRSASSIGLGVVYVEFEWGADIYRARQMVSERLDVVREVLPAGAHAEMTPITSITGEIMLLALSSPDGKMDPLQLRSYGEFELRNRLLSVPGVAQVSVIGGQLPEFQVLVDPERLRLFGLTLQDVARAARAAHSPLPAGYLTDAQHLEIPVRQSGQVRSKEDIGAVLVKYSGGVPVTLDQVADIQLGPTPARGTGSDFGHSAVILTVKKAPGTNTLAITQAVDALLDDLAPTTPAGVKVNRQGFRQADFIDLSVHNVVVALRDAGLIVAIILVLFLLNLRTTLVTLTALPLSLAAGLLTLEWLGETINVMTLGGLAIAVGSLVDDAIIDVENVFRRLKENARLPAAERRPRTSVIFEASNEIRPAMVVATAIIALVFLPLMFLEGIEGRFFRPLGIAFVVSLLASLLVALTVTPALCRLLLRSNSTRAAADTPLLALLKKGYLSVLQFALRARWWLMFASAAATAGALLLAGTFGTAFLPQFNEGTFSIGLFAPPGTSLRASDRMAGAVERQIAQIEGVRSVIRRTGRAERDEHAEPVSTSEVEITLLPGTDQSAVRSEIREILDHTPGITSNIGQPIEHRLSHILSGTPAAIAIDIFGDDLNVLRKLAQEVRDAVQELPGATDVAANRELKVETLPIRFRPRDLAAVGLTPESASEQLRAAVFGETVAQVNQGLRRYALTVRLAPEFRADEKALARLILQGAGGALVRLDQVADLGPQLAPYAIARENSQRKAVVSLNVAEGSNLGHLVEDVRQVVDPIVHGAGYRVHYGGQFEAQRSARNRMLLMSLLVLAIMILLLQSATSSWRATWLVLLNLPLALIGGVLAVFVKQSESAWSNLAALFGHGIYGAPVLSIASLVGFITLFGIAVRNGILLVNHYRTLRNEQGFDVRTAIVQGSLERLAPILMTALTAALALVPIVLKGFQPGNEILAPMSLVILGGLLSSTFLNLIVVPAGYAILHRDPPEPVPETSS